MFELTSDPLILDPLIAATAGGYVLFEGKVRNHAGGRAVRCLEYEAYDVLAISEGEALVREAVEKFGLEAARVAHRVGLLQVGETAVAIQVAAAHRREAFAGCEWIIDQLKHRVPIWKKEHFEEGDSVWVGADPPTRLPDQAAEFTRRQRALVEIGDSGQDSLRVARVLLVGVGGLASGSLPYLAGAGVGTLGLIDSDAVDITNLHRQILYAASDTGRLKVDRASHFAQRLNPATRVQVHAEPLTADNAERVVVDYDWIIDGTDSLATKFILNDICKRLRKHLVTASVHRFEGQVLTVSPDGPCLRCLFPTEPPAGCVSNCAETGVLGVVPGLFGILQANEVLKGVLGYGPMLTHIVQIIDLRTGESTRLERSHDPDCPACQGKTSSQASLWEVQSLEEAATKLGSFRLVDIRELHEFPPLEGAHERVPLSSLQSLPDAEAVVLVCSSGARSLRLASRFQALGRVNVVSLRGGIDSLISGNTPC